MTCVTFTEEHGACTWSKCMPSCFCGVDHENGLDSDGDDFSFREMQCSDSDDYNTEDGCREDLINNVDAHNECLEDNEGCDPGDYCMYYPDLDLGWTYGLRIGTITADNYRCVSYEQCFPAREPTCDSN